MSNPTDTPVAAWPALLMPYYGAICWLDASSRVAQDWAEWQRAAWQPMLDVQAEWLQRWGSAAGWPPLASLTLPRGSEQLA